ncbi:Zn-dependent hydrolase [Bacillus dakarensis]|uniref:Zn-dependent hydrolase n=1 Tax=Robertmurraya dakarensis TaxID=1926278 RepID=UPI0009812E6C|nr:Zn-dependent hydrolase [Bacillus dakarensis]
MKLLPRVDPKRIQQRLEELGRYGRNEQGGIDRTTFTKAELAARYWLRHELVALHLDVRIDEAANIWARRKGRDESLPVIAFGSHLDSVPNGGMYDGALGVVLALEVMTVLQERGIQTVHPLELVSFSAEEPNPFGLSTFGSRAVSGKLKKKDILSVTDSSGRRLMDALKEAGGDPQRFEDAVRKHDDFSAFLEVHIEQGKRLLEYEIPVGVVTGIAGIYREEVRISGEANHAGTTAMHDRRDALLTAAECILAFEHVIKNYLDQDVAGTVGQFAVKPNATNIIPGEVIFSVDLRSQNRKVIDEILLVWEIRMKEILRSRSAVVHRRVILDQFPVGMCKELIEICEETSGILGYPSLLLGSMAGHDAAHMATLTRTCMIFVPSIDGKSHCPEEKSRIEDIEKTGNVLLNSILAIDERGGGV